MTKQMCAVPAGQAGTFRLFRILAVLIAVLSLSMVLAAVSDGSDAFDFWDDDERIHYYQPGEEDWLVADGIAEGIADITIPAQVTYDEVT
ncbi:MAG: hypothetical protein IKR86_00215, partial [Candidatus Methanomethylophilaceae archaeon]|nr:hypothetical protein [Candidatus Methanomethylophilaceae archaeon]